MEFHEKLQELRKQKGMTQEELAKSLYVSRTAISKWESGRGYPGIDSLKEIAKFFSVTLDELLSTDDVLTIAEEEGKRTKKHFLDLAFGLLDLCMSLLLILPLFARREMGIAEASALFALDTVQPWLRASYIASVVVMIALGILFLALQTCQSEFWSKYKTSISFLCSTATVLLFVISLQPYATIFTFSLLILKVFLLIKRV